MATSSFSRILPAPKHNYSVQVEDDDEEEEQPTAMKKTVVIPPYLHRGHFIPHEPADFGDGGAFPEIHVAQYPLDMGRPGAKSSAVISVDVDEKGQVRYDAIVQQKGKKVQTSLADMKESDGDKGALSLPTEEEEQSTADRTRLALEALLQGKIAKAKPSTVGHVEAPEEPKYIRYTPNPNAPGYSDAAKQRVIRMVEAQVDPMEPPKHKHKKVPRGPPSPPAPVLHSPPRKLTVKDQQEWKVPACISNWKNARGYTIPLDKRLAADGRGLQEVTINNKFASLAETLYIAERKAAEDLQIRNSIRKKMAMKEKEDKELELRNMAAAARQERAQSTAGIYGPSDTSAQPYGHARGGDSSDSEAEEIPRHETSEERVARMQREKLRIERRKEREREIRLDNMKGKMRLHKIDRDEGRDISEKIALGMHKGSGKLTGEGMFDSRLFNQSAGMDAGFGDDDEYNTYSKPMFDKKEAGSIYRPRNNDTDVYGGVDEQMAKLSDTSRFKPDKGFKGAESSAEAGGRSAPVQFEVGNNVRSEDDHHDKKRSRRD